jgi:protocatechuate 3,4-dioxygenase beta subunit
MRRRFFLTIAFTVPLLMAAGLHAQNTTKADTVIKGVVLGANGKPVAAAAVECQSSAGIRPRVVHTDAKGHYLITGLKQDAYDLRANSNGAYSDWEKNIPLKKGQTKEITLRLLNTALRGTLPAKQNP